MAHPVALHTDHGATVTADVENHNGVPHIVVDRTRSNPMEHEALLALLRNESRARANFTLTGDVGFVASRASASDLRDAYLAAFALLGYRYILWPDLDDIRHQIKEGTAHGPLLRRSDQLAADFCGVITFTQPVECVGVVTPGGCCVFLPWPTKAAELLGWLDCEGPVEVSLTGRAYPWPRNMPLLLDLQSTGPDPRHQG